MKIYFIVLYYIFFLGCSFDNKSGIWQNENYQVKDDVSSVFSEFKTLSSSNKYFSEIIKLDNNFKFKSPTLVKNTKWQDIFFSQTNNYVNFKYSGINKINYKSGKISKFKINKYFVADEKNIILTDTGGNLIIYSIEENKIINKFNFYKKRYKKIKKNLNIIIEKNIAYVSDNLGFLYAYNYKIDKVLWAKNYSSPFRSNLKILNQKLVGSTENNNLYFFDKTSGNILKMIPTEEDVIKNQFVNNISVSKKNIFYLNSYGSLYSMDSEKMQINWFLNLNQTIDLNPSNLFMGNQIINYKDKTIITSNNFTYVINNKTGSIIHKKNFSSLIKPLIIEDHLFLVSKNDLLISMSLESGKIIYSYDINTKIAEFLKSKKKKFT